jgi:Chaperone of endosialidase
LGLTSAFIQDQFEDHPTENFAMARNSRMNFMVVAGLSALGGTASAQICVTSSIGNNTGCGTNTLSVTSGYYNTAIGSGALQDNTLGSVNTASGAGAMQSNLTGSRNTAAGHQALFLNTSGNYNTATGDYALFGNQTGSFNTAIGAGAMEDGPASSGNTAVGFHAMYSNQTSSDNSALGYLALYGNVSGNYNSAFGYEALSNSQSGLANIGVGPFAGRNIVQGELNIDIGSWGSADESNTIRIGITPYHAHTYIAGIYNTTGLSGLPVIITSSGQLGVGPVSSERFKTGIATMGSATENLSQLRPVTFRLRSDAQGTVHYGLIAEEVARVYPELVIRDENGRIDGVHYDELAPMLLNEVQKQQQVNAALAARVDDLEHDLAQMRTALAALQARDQLVAQR